VDDDHAQGASLVFCLALIGIGGRGVIFKAGELASSDIPPLPDGQITFRKSETDRICPALSRKIFLFRFSEINAYDPPVPPR
jgi:hypothetical protein